MFENCMNLQLFLWKVQSRDRSPLLNLIQCAFSIAPFIEIIANSLQISNIDLIFTKYNKPAFYNILL